METAKILILLGSESDIHLMQDGLNFLKEMGVGYKVDISSAHRHPEKTSGLAKNARGEGIEVIIAAAGLAAHLPGVVAAHTTLPVIGIPLKGGSLLGMDALFVHGADAEGRARSDGRDRCFTQCLHSRVRDTLYKVRRGEGQARGHEGADATGDRREVPEPESVEGRHVLNAITDIEGIRVGHASDFEGGTGCTVILFDPGAVCGIDVRGSAAGTRQVDALGPGHLVEEIHAICLLGGAAFGLDAAGGVMRYLEERNVGFEVGVARVPIVPTAVIFDLTFGSAQARPTAEMAYTACLNAGKSFDEGSVGAGTGATVGKLFTVARSMKGGVGTSSVALPDGTVVAALVVVNAFGDILDTHTGTIIAGARTGEKRSASPTRSAP